MKPLISVITRTYNAQEFIERAVQSALRQTFDPQQYEILIVDDGSTDNTLSILAQYRKRLAIITQEHKGPMIALNTGISRARGTYIILLDSDDEFKPETLKELYGALKKNPRAAFAYSDYYERDATTKELILVSPRNNMFHTVAGGILWKKRVVEHFGGYDSALIFPEYDLLLKVRKKYAAIYVPKALFYYNRRKESLMGQKGRDTLGKEQLRRRYGDIPEIAKIRNY